MDLLLASVHTSWAICAARYCRMMPRVVYRGIFGRTPVDAQVALMQSPIFLAVNNVVDNEVDK